MIPISFKVKLSGVAGMTKRELNEDKADAYAETGRYWHKHFRPKHFTKEGAREYGYLPRKGEPGNPHPKGFWASYTGRKLREQKHKLPLVWSGQSRALSAMGRVRATSKGVKVTMPARALNFKHPKSKIKMAEELRTVSAGELRELERRWMRKLEANVKLREARLGRTIVIR